MGKQGFPPFIPSRFRASIKRECATLRCPFRIFSLSNLRTIFFRGEAVIPQVANLHDYVNHMIKNA
jgi:hypothetical protein